MGTQGSTQQLIVLAVDDEAHGLNELVHQLRQNSRVGRVLTAFDAAEALRVIRSPDPELEARTKAGLCPVDAVFADISMPGLTGLDLARVFTAFRDPPALVFVTGHQEHSLDAYDLGALDYIVKPPKQERIERVMRLIERTRFGADSRAASGGGGGAATDSSEEEVIPVELAGTTKLIPRSEIRWVEAQGDYARLHTTDGSHLVRIPLAQLEERWGEAGFVRIHRSYLVALPLVKELRMSSNGYSVVIGDAELPVSRRHTRELKDRLVRAPKTNWEQNR
ncbi:DNA-binding response regulator [Pseudonocardiaceae bacterium YIM PH 21723]|nr:DNA-binding response regulator [Pseudonocardiaceae bacterium YIM PH 21723]